MSLLSRVSALALFAALLAGCQALGGALGGGGGVMPATEVGPPPSLRGSLPGRESRIANVDADGQPLQTEPTRRLDLPKNAAGAGRSADAGTRRIRREDIEGNDTPRQSAGGGMAPALGSSGNVGLGGRF